MIVSSRMNCQPINRQFAADPPDLLDDAYRCLCGGHAVLKSAKSIDAHLECDNARCGRRTPFGLPYVETMIAWWNQDIREDQCEAHSWMLQPDDAKPCKPQFKCAHCGALMT